MTPGDRNNPHTDNQDRCISSQSIPIVMSSDDAVLFETRGRVAIITLNRPKKLNAITQAHSYAISNYLREADSRDDIWVTVLTAKGRFFSA